MAFGQKDENNKNGWRARFLRPDGTYGNRSGFTSRTAAKAWGDEQEALIRRRLWIDPRDAETPFETVAEKWYETFKPRITTGTAVKYRSQLDNHVIPQWGTWPSIAIFNGYVEIEEWVSQLHEDYAESTVCSIFALFSTILNFAVRDKLIPANPCSGVKVTIGEFERECLIATPAQGLRAAMRMYRTGMGLAGFVLCLLDLYTGARWSELVGQQRHEYNDMERAIAIREPLKEVNGKVSKGGHDAIVGAVPEPTDFRSGRRPRRAKDARTKTPAGTRAVQLPPSIAVFYEMLMKDHEHPFVICTPEGRPLRRANFRQRYWRPVWDGVKPDRPEAAGHAPAILPWFTFHEGRHTHSTWLTEDGIAEVARRGRLGQKMKGIARVYDHVTPAMKDQILDVLEARWFASLAALTASERRELGEWFPHLGPALDAAADAQAKKIFATFSPHDLDRTRKTANEDRWP